MPIERGGTSWRVERFATEAALQDYARRAQSCLPIDTTVHDVEWQSIERPPDDGSLIVLVDAPEGGISGQAILSASDAPLEYAFGDFVFFRRHVPQYVMHFGPISTRADHANAIEECLQEVALALPQVEVLSLKSVPIGSVLHNSIERSDSLIRRHFFILPWGNESLYCRIRWNGRVETYLQSIGKETRRNLARYSKKLFADASIRASVRRFEPEQAEEFLREFAPLIEKTWQRKQSIVTLNPAAELRIRFAARKRSFLGYILYVNHSPVAYRYCFICGKTAVMFQTGYDPSWASYRVSNVLFLEVLKDFERHAVPVTSLDFLPHITPFKLHTTNDQRPSRNYYMFRRNISGMVNFATLALTDRISRLGGALAKYVYQYVGPARDRRAILKQDPPSKHSD